MSIRISEKHGVNPTIPICFYCGNDKNQIVLMGRLPNDKEAPKNTCFDKEPCDKCKEYMKQGVILVSVKNGSDRKNPYRTGGWVVVKEDFVKRVFGENMTSRFAFLEDEAWDKLGLPRK
jgi:hypothetical protein